MDNEITISLRNLLFLAALSGFFAAGIGSIVPSLNNNILLLIPSFFGATGSTIGFFAFFFVERRRIAYASTILVIIGGILFGVLPSLFDFWNPKIPDWVNTLSYIGMLPYVLGTVIFPFAATSISKRARISLPFFAMLGVVLFLGVSLFPSTLQPTLETGAPGAWAVYTGILIVGIALRFFPRVQTVNARGENSTII